MLLFSRPLVHRKSLGRDSWSVIHVYIYCPDIKTKGPVEDSHKHLKSSRPSQITRCPVALLSLYVSPYNSLYGENCVNRCTYARYHAACFGSVTSHTLPSRAHGYPSCIKSVHVHPVFSYLNRRVTRHMYAKLHSYKANKCQ